MRESTPRIALHEMRNDGIRACTPPAKHLCRPEPKKAELMECMYVHTGYVQHTYRLAYVRHSRIGYKYTHHIYSTCIYVLCCSSLRQGHLLRCSRGDSSIVTYDGLELGLALCAGVSLAWSFVGNRCMNG